ncbi:MAG: potassium transporter TrkG [Candidatus Micrarchaeia archaeon]
MRLQEIFSTLTLILFYTSLPLLIPFFYAYYYHESTLEPIGTVLALMMAPAIPILLPSIFRKFAGIINSLIQFLFKREAPWNFALNIFMKKPELSTLKFGDILAVAALAWIVIPLICAYPYYYYGISIHDSIFESISGWTSTGLSIITNFDNLPKSLILFRSISQWVGGLGIVLLMLSFIKHRQSKNLLAFESKGEIGLGTAKTASKIWLIYIYLTIFAICALVLSGMNIFNSTNLAFAGLSNGGFFPFLSYDFTWVQKLILSGTMFLGAISFVTHNRLFSLDFRALFGEEFIFFVVLIILSIALIYFVGHDELNNSFLNAISAIACGGFAIGNLSIMHNFSIYVLILLMIFGGMYGSTTGGLKLWRILVALKLVFSKIRSYFLPSGSVQVVRVDGQSINEGAIVEVLAFIFIYLMLFVLSAGLFMAWNYGTEDSLFIVASALGNVGLSTFDIASMSIASKYFLGVLMYVGRIEIFPVLALMRFIFGRQ